MAFRPRLPHRRRVERRSRCRFLALILCVGLAGAILTVPPASVRSSAQVLQAGEAQVYVAALRRDRPVMGLGPLDFRIEEDGDRREVLRVEPATAAFNVALLVDDSMVASNNIVHIREALASFVEAMRGHRLSLIAFGDQRQTLVDYTADTALLRQAAERFSGFAETSAFMVAAGDETARQLAARQAMRPAIVLLTTEGRGMQDMSIRGIGLPARGRSTPGASRDQDAEAVAGFQGELDEALRNGEGIWGTPFVVACPCVQPAESTAVCSALMKISAPGRRVGPAPGSVLVQPGQRVDRLTVNDDFKV